MFCETDELLNIARERASGQLEGQAVLAVAAWQNDGSPSGAERESVQFTLGARTMTREHMETIIAGWSAGRILVGNKISNKRFPMKVQGFGDS